MVTTGDKFWVDNVDILFSMNELFNVFPTKDMTMNEKLNTITRLAIYVFLFFYILTGTDDVLLIPIFVVFGLIIFQRKTIKEGYVEKVYKRVEQPLRIVQPQESLFDDFNKLSNKDDVCRRPTKNNPFMNPMPFDKQQKTCGSDREVKDSFYDNLYMDFDNLFEKYNSERQYHTLPAREYPNKQTEFARWVSGQDDTCKMYGNSCSTFY